jgi:hypothetical protein
MQLKKLIEYDGESEGHGISDTADFNNNYKTKWRGKAAYVIDVFNSGNGKRYIVDSGGFRWSVHERELQFSIKKV